jgi:asparagine synthase (glutamine-hydrolysing)
VDSEAIRGLGLFNDEVLNRLLKLWSTSTTKSTNTVDEAIAWLASLSVFVEKYMIKGYQNLSPPRLKDKILSWKSSIYAYAYIKARERYRD